MSDTLKNMYKLVLSDCIANGRGYSTSIEVSNIPDMVSAVTELKPPCAVTYRIPAGSNRASFVMEPPCSEHTSSSKEKGRIEK